MAKLLGPVAILAGLITAALILVYFGLTPAVATFHLDGPAPIANALLGLFVAALFMERLQEVFVTAWREQERKKLEAAVHAAKTNLAAVQASQPTNATQIDSASKALVQHERNLEIYRIETQRFAFVFGIAVGFLFAAAGVRSLSETMNYENLQGAQYAVFQFMDLFVTAGVIAGGSDAIHQLISIFTDGMKATRARLQAATP